MQRDGGLAAPLAVVGSVFVLLQVLSPIHHAVGANLGSRTAARLTDDLTMARDFDLGISGPPLNISMDFIAAYAW